MILMWLWVALLGGIMNRIRGGMFEVPFNGPLNAGVFGAAAGFAAQDWVLGLLAAVAMFVGQAPGWGRYIGAMGGWETQELKEFFLVDWLIKPIKAKYDEFKHTYMAGIAQGYKEAWGAWGLALRGLFWGGLIALAIQDPLPAIAGFSMPAWYAAGFTGAKAAKADNWQGTGWEIGEWLFGAVLWLTTFFAIFY